MEDNSILDLYFKRDQLAIEETAKKYGKYCNTISYNILFDSYEADECVNDTYLRAWNSIPPNRPAVFRAYLAKITRNLSLNRLEKREAEKRGGKEYDIALSEIENTVSSNDSQLEDKEIILLINAFLETLKKEQRIMFVRRYCYLDSLEKVAADFNLSENRAAVILFRIRKKLKDYLLKEGVEL